MPAECIGETKAITAQQPAAVDGGVTAVTITARRTVISQENVNCSVPAVLRPAERLRVPPRTPSCQTKTLRNRTRRFAPPPTWGEQHLDRHLAGKAGKIAAKFRQAALSAASSNGNSDWLITRPSSRTLRRWL